MPILCNYYLTYRCNAYCDFCHFGNHDAFRHERHADTDTVLRNLHGLRKLGVRFIDLTGGEPLLHPDVAVIAGEAQRLGMKTSITTNGLLYSKQAEQLRGRVDLLHFSLDSADREEHDRMRGVKCFDAVIKSVSIAKQLGEHPDLLFTVTNENYEQLDAVYDIAEQYGLILLINPLFSYFREDGLASDALNAAERTASRPSAYLNTSFLKLRRIGGNDIRNPLCKAVSRVIVVSPHNEILLPCYHQSTESIPIGNDILKAYTSPRIAWHKAMEGRHSFCQDCTINCYFEPSFAFPTNLISLASVPSKLKYGFNKYVKRNLFR